MSRLSFPLRRALPVLILVLVIAFVQFVGRANWPLASSAPAPTAEIATSAQVVTVNPKIGVHTRLTDEAEPEKITKTLQMVREMGAPWVVEYFPWSYIQPNGPNEFDWTHADTVINEANAQGLTLVARIDGVPWWARPEKTTWRYLDQSHYQDYANFVSAFVTRYKGKVRYYVIWNEPNLSSEWGQRKVSPEDYAELLKVTYPRVKQADPNALVVSAGLAPTLEPEGSEWGLEDLTYLERMYRAGAAAYFDVMAIHAYGLQAPPDDPAAPKVINFARAELIHDVMVRFGDGQKKCLITEGGWNDDPRWIYAVRPYQRIEYTLRAYEKAAKDWPWVDGVALWAFRFPKPNYNYFDSYAFVTPDFIPKAIYLEVQRYAKGEVTVNDGPSKGNG